MTLFVAGPADHGPAGRAVFGHVALLIAVVAGSAELARLRAVGLVVA